MEFPKALMENKARFRPESLSYDTSVDRQENNEHFVPLVSFDEFKANFGKPRPLLRVCDGESLHAARGSPQLAKHTLLPAEPNLATARQPISTFSDVFKIEGPKNSRQPAESIRPDDSSKSKKTTNSSPKARRRKTPAATAKPKDLTPATAASVFPSSPLYVSTTIHSNPLSLFSSRSNPKMKSPALASKLSPNVPSASKTFTTIPSPNPYLPCTSAATTPPSPAPGTSEDTGRPVADGNRAGAAVSLPMAPSVASLGSTTPGRKYAPQSPPQTACVPAPQSPNVTSPAASTWLDLDLEKQAAALVVKHDPEGRMPSTTVDPETTSTPYSDATQSKKKPKDGHTKRPMNCFMVWSQQERREIIKNHPGMHNAAISKMLGARWKELPEEERARFRAEAIRLGLLHRREHPGYKYTPRKKEAKTKASTTVVTDRGRVSKPPGSQEEKSPKRGKAKKASPHPETAQLDMKPRRRYKRRRTDASPCPAEVSPSKCSLSASDHTGSADVITTNDGLRASHTAFFTPTPTYIPITSPITSPIIGPITSPFRPTSQAVAVSTPPNEAIVSAAVIATNTPGSSDLYDSAYFAGQPLPSGKDVVFTTTTTSTSTSTSTLPAVAMDTVSGSVPNDLSDLDIADMDSLLCRQALDSLGFTGDMMVDLGLSLVLTEHGDPGDVDSQVISDADVQNIPESLPDDVFSL